MNDSRWGHGYVTDAHYAETYFRELSPSWLNYVTALHGIRGPALDRPFTYLELGCGFGQSTTVHAAAFPRSAFYGCDFNAAHVHAAAEYARACGIGNVRFTDAPFDQLSAGPLPPAFDYVALHGVYSWVDASVRQAIRRILAECLRPGGVAYVSYNCLPGWTAELPLRRLMRELALDASGDTPARTREAIEHLREFANVPLRFFKAHPAAIEAVESYSQKDPEYLAHEFLNEAWEPFYSIDVADDMASIDLTYVGSATLPDNHPLLLVDDQSSRTCRALPSPRLQELAFDFATNRRFRRDVFVKSADDEPGTSEAYLDTVVGAIEDPVTIEAKARVPRGDIRFQQAFIDDLRLLLAREPMAIREILARLPDRTVGRADVIRNIALLVAAGSLSPFAGPHRTDGEPASAAATHILRQIAADGRPRAVPGNALGYGIMTTQADAEKALDWSARQNRDNNDVRIVAERLQRIGALAQDRS